MPRKFGVVWFYVFIAIPLQAKELQSQANQSVAQANQSVADKEKAVKDCEAQRSEMIYIMEGYKADSDKVLADKQKEINTLKDKLNVMEGYKTDSDKVLAEQLKEITTLKEKLNISKKKTNGHHKEVHRLWKSWCVWFKICKFRIVFVSEKSGKLRNCNWVS